MGEKLPQIVLVGAPNVGKSMIFNYLTGAYVIVSNYPGTTVDISRGRAVIGGKVYEVVDTPGIYSLSPLTAEERVTIDILRTSKPDLLIHVIDAKNIRRMLPLTLQLLDGGFSLLLVLNIMDEAEDLGIRICLDRLRERLGIPIIATSAVQNRGLQLLRKAIDAYQPMDVRPIALTSETEKVIVGMEKLLTIDYGFAQRLSAMLLLQADDFMKLMAQAEPKYDEIQEINSLFKKDTGNSVQYRIVCERQEAVEAILQDTVRFRTNQRQNRKEWFNEITCHPLLGLPALFAVIYVGLYQFVGQFGAGFLVDFMNYGLFGQFLEPMIREFVSRHIPWEWGQSLLIGEYGVFSLGIRYAVAIILPVAGTFFTAFAVLEDCGYLPRLALLTNQFFQALGLNGRAVIPVTLGLGCGTMAVMVTRTLETRKERLLATFLLALAIPCSAQLGLVLSLLSHNGMALLLWTTYVVSVFLFAGWLGAKATGSEGSTFYMELPPLRLPQLSNIIKKATYRMTWYFIEILPVFIGTSILLWAADRSGLLKQAINLLEPAVQQLDLPGDCAQVLLLGFFRRDYGAAGLYDLAGDGRLSDHQLLVAAIVLTLFMPCVAQFTVMIKEQGWITAVSMAVIISLVAFGSGWLVNKGVSLLCLL